MQPEYVRKLAIAYVRANNYPGDWRWEFKKSIITFGGCPVYQLQRIDDMLMDKELANRLDNNIANMIRKREKGKEYNVWIGIHQNMAHGNVTDNGNEEYRPDQIFALVRCKGKTIRNYFYVRRNQKNAISSGNPYLHPLNKGDAFSPANWELFVKDVLFLFLWSYANSSKVPDENITDFFDKPNLEEFLDWISQAWLRTFGLPGRFVATNLITELTNFAAEDREEETHGTNRQILMITAVPWAQFVFTELFDYWSGPNIKDKVADGWKNPSTMTAMRELSLRFHNFAIYDQNAPFDILSANKMNNYGVVMKSDIYENVDGPSIARLFVPVNDRQIYLAEMSYSTAIEAQLRWCFLETGVSNFERGDFTDMQGKDIFRTMKCHMAFGNTRLQGVATGKNKQSLWMSVAHLPKDPDYELDMLWGGRRYVIHDEERKKDDAGRKELLETLGMLQFVDRTYPIYMESRNEPVE